MDNCTIFLGFTSNMISSGVRETIKYLLKNNMVGKKGFGVISTSIQYSYFIGEFTRSLAIYVRYFMYCELVIK